MRSPLPKVWDAPATQLRGLKYREATLRAIFDRSEETAKRPGVYTLGRIHLGGKSPAAPAPQLSAVISKATQNGTYGVIAPGVTSEDGLTENCLGARLQCLDESASPTLCPRNKCIVGRINYDQSLGLWHYESVNHFRDTDGGSSPLEYYTESKLKSNPSFYSNGLVIDAPATVAYEVIPAMELPLRSEVRVDVAMRAFAEVCRYREACIQSHLLEPADELIRLGILSHAHSLGPVWQEYNNNEIATYFYNELSAGDLLSSYLDTLDTKRNCILLVNAPRYKMSRITDLGDSDYARPVYSRMPESYKTSDPDIKVLSNIAERHLLPQDLPLGAIVVNSAYSEAYQYLPRAISDPEERLRLGADPLSKTTLFSPADTLSWRKIDPPSPPLTKWVSGGTDKLLSDKKLLLDQFYYNYLYPRTCDPEALDWVRVFFGFTDGLWNQSWEPEQKRQILLNAFGWYDRSVVDEISGYKTLKGEVVRNSGIWTDNPEQSNFDQVIWSNRFLSKMIRVEDLYISEPLDFIKIYSGDWEGLHTTKGTLLNLIWWLDTFNIIGCSATNEIEDIGAANHFILSPLTLTPKRSTDPASLGNKFRIKQTLEHSEADRLSWPILMAPAQASDIESANYVGSPLIAGATQIQTESILVIPISFRYSRYSEVWDRLEYIIDNWSPAHTKIRAQYSHVAADYAVAGDLYFDDINVVGTPWHLDNPEFVDNFDYTDDFLD